MFSDHLETHIQRRHWLAEVRCCLEADLHVSAAKDHRLKFQGNPCVFSRPTLHIVACANISCQSMTRQPLNDSLFSVNGLLRLIATNESIDIGLCLFASLITPIEHSYQAH
jgi:hypothetical protein